MDKICEAAEVRKWNAMMDALEANWQMKMADTRKEYQQDRLPTNKKMPELLISEPPSA